MGKRKKYILISFAILLIIVLGIGGFVGNYFYNTSLNPNASNRTLPGSSKNEENPNWILDESNYIDSYITSNNNLNLHAYEINNNSNIWVITVHGYNGQGYKMDGYAKEFYNMGYNVLAPDLRGHGKSQGDYIGMGWDDRLDIVKWINYIIKKDENAEIILHGISMGAATVMMTSGEDLPDNVKCIIEDSGYTSVWDEFSHELNKIFNLPDTPILQLANVATKVRAGYFFSDASSVKQLKKAKKPMLFVHGDQDDFVPYYMLDTVYDSANVEKEKLVIEGAAHTKALEVNPDLYWEKISEFVKKYI